MIIHRTIESESVEQSLRKLLGLIKAKRQADAAPDTHSSMVAVGVNHTACEITSNTNPTPSSQLELQQSQVSLVLDDAHLVPPLKLGDVEMELGTRAWYERLIYGQF